MTIQFRPQGDDDPTCITSRWSIHTASRAAGVWQCTWLPGRDLSRAEVITAMNLADLLGRPSGHASTSLAMTMANELGLVLEEAVGAIEQQAEVLRKQLVDELERDADSLRRINAKAGVR